jgi:Tfp pilus assembly protein PilV
MKTRAETTRADREPSSGARMSERSAPAFRRARWSLRRSGAFTLIEAIVALVVIGIAVPPMVIAVSDATVRRVDGVLATRARWLAAERLEDILADRHSSTRGYVWVTGANYASESAVSGFAGFSRSVSVSETGATLVGAGTGYKTCSVSVGWRDSRGRARTLTLSTVVTDYTP